MGSKQTVGPKRTPNPFIPRDGAWFHQQYGAEGQLHSYARGDWRAFVHVARDGDISWTVCRVGEPATWMPTAKDAEAAQALALASLNDRQRTVEEILAVVRGCFYARKSDPTVTLPRYVREQIRDAHACAVKRRQMAEDTSRSPNARMMLVEMAERSERAATTLIGLRARFESWRD